MKILVIGSSGYLGYWISRTLASQGHSIVELSRRGSAWYGEGMSGDVTKSRLGLDESGLNNLHDAERIVSTFGTVNWDLPPTEVVDLHVNGTRNVLDLAASLPNKPTVLHVSSLLALGRTDKVVGNRELSVGQSFRNWYEFAKYRAERLVRNETRIPVRIARFGPLLGSAPADLIPITGGPVQVLSQALQGLPLILEDAGRYPIYAGDVAVAGEIAASLATSDTAPDVATYFDPSLPTLARILHELCAAWGVTPRLVQGGAKARWLQAKLGENYGLSASVLDYSSRLPVFETDVLQSLIPPVPTERDFYVSETAEVLRKSRRVLAQVEAKVPAP